jgi:hypothetical protein
LDDSAAADYYHQTEILSAAIVAENAAAFAFGTSALLLASLGSTAIALGIGLPLTVAGIRVVHPSLVDFNTRNLAAVTLVVPMLIAIADAEAEQ